MENNQITPEIRVFHDKMSLRAGANNFSPRFDCFDSSQQPKLNASQRDEFFARWSIGCNLCNRYYWNSDY